jgi:ABC-type Mn2+/Zn2+ transport system ATPase subunit
MVLERLAHEAREHGAVVVMVVHDLLFASRYCDRFLLLYGDGASRTATRRRFWTPAILASCTASRSMRWTRVVIGCSCRAVLKGACRMYNRRFHASPTSPDT